MAFEDNDIISTTGGDSNGTFSYPKAGQTLPPGRYVIAAMSGDWASRTISVRCPDRSGNYVIPEDADGNALTSKAANFSEEAVLTSSGVQFILAGTGDSDITITVERVN